MKNTVAAFAIAGSALFSGIAQADSPAEKAQELRQAPMVLVGNNFGLMWGMLDGKIPWDSSEFRKRAAELAALGRLDMTRGYQIPESYEGHTKASTDILKNRSDFDDKMSKLREDLKALDSTLEDESALKTAIKDLGKNCKSCHKKYKNKNYNG